MKEILETVPNVSEGRDEEIIEKLAETLSDTEGVVLLDTDPDPDHNRTVFTLAGERDGIFDAVMELFELSIDLIDLNDHEGEHPRMGAVDVVPFIPVKNVDMDDCVDFSEKVGEEVGDRFDIPKRANRENLSDIRRGEFESFPEKIRKEDWRPDYGPREIHPTAGVTAVGAREFLIAYNVNLRTEDLEIAKEIARTVRESSGGLQNVKALGFRIEEENCVQVSMNLENFKETPIPLALELIKREAKRYGVPVMGSEIVGLVPQAALNETARYYLGLAEFEENQIFENRLDEKSEK